MQPKWNWDLEPVNVAAENQRPADLKGDGNGQEGNPGGKGEAEDALGGGCPAHVLAAAGEAGPSDQPSPAAHWADSMAAPPLLSPANFLWSRRAE